MRASEALLKAESQDTHQEKFQDEWQAAARQRLRRVKT
ncbi:MAG: hypothetical protein ANABAC_3530 [Anaerolineae bacterium]|nr:MAG: hypothetical protein ANABAC_3530 [Anaerolineae bacterium]